MKRPTSSAPGVLLLALTLGVSGLWAASDPTPTPTLTPNPTPTPAPQPQSLAEAARQATTGAGGGEGTTPTRTPIVISNDNLADLAAQGTLTEVTLTSRGSSPGGNRVSSTGSGGAEESKKAHWRGRYKAQKDVIEAIKGEIEALDLEIPGLWNQFYSWDDPAYRDGVIKVRLDEALGRREELAKQLPEEEARLPQILNEARRDGALPGWFRDLK